MRRILTCFRVFCVLAVMAWTAPLGSCTARRDRLRRALPELAAGPGPRAAHCIGRAAPRRRADAGHVAPRDRAHARESRGEIRPRQCLRLTPARRPCRQPREGLSPTCRPRWRSSPVRPIRRAGAKPTTISASPIGAASTASVPTTRRTPSRISSRRWRSFRVRAPSGSGRSCRTISPSSICSGSEGERADNQEKTIAHLEAALTVFTREAEPLLWAQAQSEPRQRLPRSRAGRACGQSRESDCPHRGGADRAHARGLPLRVGNGANQPCQRVSGSHPRGAFQQPGESDRVFRRRADGLHQGGIPAAVGDDTTERRQRILESHPGRARRQPAEGDRSL